jgi:hypothetical protein
MIWSIIFSCNWVATRWQLFSTNIHTNNTENVTKRTVHRKTQKIHRTAQQLGRVRAVPRFCGFYPGICLTTEEKARKNLCQGSHTNLQCVFYGYRLRLSYALSFRSDVYRCLVYALMWCGLVLRTCSMSFQEFIISQGTHYDLFLTLTLLTWRIW